MKKNYMAPTTEMQTWASMGLMQDPTIGFATGSGTKTFNEAEQID